MDSQGRTYGGPLRALSFVLLVGILSMHGLTSHQILMPWTEAMSVEHGAGPEASNPGSMGSGPLISEREFATSDGRASASEIRPQFTTPDMAEHAAMDQCLAVLSLLLLLTFLVRTRRVGHVRWGSSLLRSFRRTAGRAPPDHLCPSLTGLCVSRV
jgi:hypothetical protein